MKTQPYCLLAFLLSFANVSSAAIFAREDFNYPSGNLLGRNGGSGWSAAWANAQGTPTVSNNKGIINSITGGGQQGARLISTLQAPPTGGSKTIWVSFTARQFTSLSGTTNSYGGLSLYKGANEAVLIGKAWPGTYEWRAGTGGGLIGPSIPVSTLNTTSIIAKLEMVDGTATANDTLSVWLNPADTSSEAALGTAQIIRTDPDLSFDTLRIRGGSGAGGTESWEFDSVAAGDTLADVLPADSDSDGILDSWENVIIDHAALQVPAVTLTLTDIKGPNDAPVTSDYDSDGATDATEYANSSDPTNPDTDTDTLLDGVETGTGIWVSLSNRGTSPIDTDTDNDGLWDDYEINSGIWVSSTDTGTSPHKADTDGDGFMDIVESNDGTTIDLVSPGTNPNLADTDGDTFYDRLEIRVGTDPFQSSSVITPGDLTVIGTDDFNYADGPFSSQNGGSGFDFDNNALNDPFIGHTTLKSDWDVFSGTSAKFEGGKLFTAESGVIREFNGDLEGTAVNGDEYVGAVKPDGDSKVVYFRADMTRGAEATWSGMSSFDFGSQRLFFGVPWTAGPSGQREFGIEVSGVSTSFRSSNPINPLTGQTYTIVAKLDFENDLLSLWVNPDLTKTEMENVPYLTRAYTEPQWSTRAMLSSGGPAATPSSWDNFVVARHWSAVGTFVGVTPNNYTTWIGSYPGATGATGFSQDADNDGIANGVEAFFGTDPSVATAGLTQISHNGAAFKFRHSRTNMLPSDVTASYEWSTDLVNWNSSDQTDASGVTAVISSSTVVNNSHPALDEIEVTATVTAGITGKIFVRLLTNQ